MDTQTTHSANETRTLEERMYKHFYVRSIGTNISAISRKMSSNQQHLVVVLPIALLIILSSRTISSTRAVSQQFPGTTADDPPPSADRLKVKPTKHHTFPLSTLPKLP